MVRAIGLDLGARRVGVAISDTGGLLATPYEVIDRQQTALASRLKEIIEDEGASVVVIGLPLSLSGDEGPAAQAARKESEALAAELPVPVELFDERLTTVSADRSLEDARMRVDARRRVVDKVAAAVMLQNWLEGHRG